MLGYMLSLGPFAIVVICVILPNLLAVPVVAAVLGRRITLSEADAIVLAPAVGFIGTSFSLLLAFVTVTVWSDQTAGQQVLFNEITTIENVLVQSKTIVPEKATALKASALKYLDSMREREIDGKPPMGGDPATERLFEEALQTINQMEKAISVDPSRQAEATAFFNEAREWIQDREERVNKPLAELDQMIIGILICLALLTVLSVAVLPSTTTVWAKWVQTVGVATTVGLVMSLVFYIASQSFTRQAEDEKITGSSRRCRTRSRWITSIVRTWTPR